MCLNPSRQNVPGKGVANRTPDYRLPREARLNPSEYRIVLSGGKCVAGRYFVIRSQPSDGASAPRFGLIAGRRSFRLAVDRNRIRRRIREIFRHNRHALRENGQLVVIARKAARDATIWELNREFLRLCQRAGIRKIDDV